ncbi:NAD(P)H-dependent oxidoreductase [Heliorestis convoluta]|uniref:NADPH-dependent FMN reductase n=1 Tax=Heliorestis convoluta TaxID=356322 RepID=A0A5Q2N0K4_9FIRM|nr:NAD(P)H-dependent oxidoreductase [Heliorestis convoluta]QGG48844.1 NADPH-dependent FMN reductase [Heliorestis convoluta]
MGAVILNATESENTILHDIESLLTKKLAQKNVPVHAFQLRKQRILPCTACGSCSMQSPGLCVAQDDQHEIMKAIVNNSLLVLLTPIRFGGYNSLLKKAADKFQLMALPTFACYQGHMIRAGRYNNLKALLAIGIEEIELPGQAKSFAALVEHNALNMQVSYHQALTFKRSQSLGQIEAVIATTLKECCHDEH